MNEICEIMSTFLVRIFMTFIGVISEENSSTVSKHMNLGAH